MSEHALLAPSSAHKRIHCPGSRALEAAYPEIEPSQSSLEGTAAHWAASEYEAGRTIDVGLIAPNGVMLTDEMVDGAELYVADIRATDAEFEGCPVVVEQRVDISTIHPDCWGTPDAWRYKPRKLVVWDYKFGHRYVEIFENWQLIEYAAGILDQVGVNGLSDQYTEVEMRIVQPRCYVGGEPIRVWRIMAVDLRNYFNHLRNREAVSMSEDAKCIVNPHCRDCTGRHACQALQRAAYGDMDVATSTVAFDLPPDALGRELRFIEQAIERLTARQTGLAEQALSAIKRGQRVLFYKAEPSMGRQRWNKPDAEIIALGDMMGVPLAKSKVITPKQALIAGLDPTLVGAFAETPFGETKLKADDGTDARKIFS